MNNQKMRKAFRVFLVVFCVAVCLAVTCFAATDIADTELGQGVSAALSSIQKYVFVISTPICGISAIVCFIRMMMTADTKVHETMKSWFIRIIIAWVGINGLAWILNGTASLVGVSTSYTTPT